MRGWLAVPIEGPGLHARRDGTTLGPRYGRDGGTVSQKARSLARPGPCGGASWERKFYTAGLVTTRGAGRRIDPTLVKRRGDSRMA